MRFDEKKWRVLAENKPDELHSYIPQSSISELFDEIDRLERKIKKLEEDNEDLKSRLDDYRQDYEKVVNDQCPTDERHCGCVPILRRENRLQSEELANTKLKLQKYQKALLLIITMTELSQAITVAKNVLEENGKHFWTAESVGEYWVNQLEMLQDKYNTLEDDYRDVCAKRLEAANNFSRQIIELENKNRELQKFYDEMTDTARQHKEEK